MRLGRAFGALGASIGARPLLFFVPGIALFIGSIVLLTIIRPSMVLSFDSGYTTADAPSIKELQAQIGFFGNRGKPWYMALFAQPRNMDMSMTKGKQFDEFKQFYKKVKTELIISKSPRNTTYMDYCEPMCDFNGVLFMTVQMAWFDPLKWPVTTLLGYNSNIGKHFFERTIDEEGELVSAKLSGLYFMVFINDTKMENEMEEFERLVQQEVKLYNSMEGKAIRITQHGARQVELEISRGTRMVLQKIIIGFIGLSIIAVGTLALMNKAHGRCTLWVLGTSLTILAVPAMGLISATVVFALFGGHLNTLSSLTPLLAYAFGFDGMLHLYNAWLYESNMRKDSFSEILREVFASVYPTVTFVLAPSVGYLFGGLFPIPEIANLSLFFGTTILFTYFYQTFVFAPSMMWCSPIFHHSPLPTETSCNTGCGNLSDCWSVHVTEPLGRLIAQSKLLIIAGIFIWAALIGLPIIFGAEKLEGNLDYRHLLPPDSPSNKGIHFMSDRVWPEFLHIVYIIESPPNLENPQQYSRFMQFIAETEKVPGAMDPIANMMWINDFKRFSKTPDNATHLDMSKFEKFINDSIYKAWRSGVQFTTREGEVPKIDRMVYMVAVEGTRTMADKARVMQNFRAISLRYPEFNAIPFDTEVTMVDVILQIPAALWFIPLFIYSALFILLLLITFNVAISVVAVTAAISVYTGTLFTSALLGMTLNPFSVGFILLCAGIIPRFVVHIAYYFQQVVRLIGKGGDAQVTRMQETLKKALLPTLLSALAGSFILMPVLFSQIVIFRRLAIINLVQVFFGLLHAIIFVPVLLNILPRQLTGISCLRSSN